MGATAIATTAIIGAVAGAGSAYMQGKSEREALKQQYQIEEYNAQMDKAEKERVSTSYSKRFTNTTADPTKRVKSDALLRRSFFPR